MAISENALVVWSDDSMGVPLVSSAVRRTLGHGDIRHRDQHAHHLETSFVPAAAVLFSRSTRALFMRRATRVRPVMVDAGSSVGP
jgi:hypothetical protein